MTFARRPVDHAARCPEDRCRGTNRRSDTMSTHLHPTGRDEQVDYRAAEGLHDLEAQEPLTIPPELVTPDDRREWSLVAAGLAGVVAVLAAVLAVFAFAA